MVFDDTSILALDIRVFGAFGILLDVIRHIGTYGDYVLGVPRPTMGAAMGYRRGNAHTYKIISN